jgi:lipid II:glycine glycyltransferase (peptidoglycan interpeptide bridge formation enzyme)
MKLEIKEVEKGKYLDDFVKGSPNSNFMQSLNWSIYQQEGLGRVTYRLGAYDGESLLGLAYCYEIPQTFGKYIYCSRGPILKEFSTELYMSVLEGLKGYFKEKGYMFLKIDPSIKKENEISHVPLSIGFKRCINYVQPETPWFIDLVEGGGEEQMKWCQENGMGKNYPTYIRKARRLGVSVRFSKEKEDWKLFTRYLRESSNKKDFVINDSEYYIKQLEYLGEDNEIRLGIAQYEGEAVAMLILSFFGNEVSCLYSCQTGTQSKVRGAMLLRWECMLQAQREGFKYFNSWDVLADEKYKPSAPRYGYSNFKRGFGGYLVRYVRSMDYPYSCAKYLLVRVLDLYRKLRYYRDR